jgi:type IV pilus assembly protein PilM
MAKSNAVWGIDIGQCALKALRCTPGEEPGRITADAFDFIEYPKILSQPEADPVELVRDALQQFLSRNKVRGDRVAVSVPGQSGLARFIKLPPVESKKIPDIVRYEARQQIPFALEDVVWDYQQMAGGSEEEGYALETEVGLFAMKRDQAARSLRPFNDAAIDVDIVQLTPLAIYNYIVFDQLQDLPPVDQYDPKDPPPSIIVVSLGTDTTDLVVTNGYRVWQRNIPLGGNHFTKALTKELKLTFTKAEHLKRNALKAEDPKAVFLAMRPVFNDLVTEVQRSISFFQSVDRNAKIGRVITLGNAMKLRGLQKYLAQSLGYEVIDLEDYRGLSGASVVGAPSFRENLLSFAVCYGLCLQGLKQSQLRTNLIPREILQDRLIQSKKPWAIGAVAAILLGCCVSYAGGWVQFHSVDDAGDSASARQLKLAISDATSTKSEIDGFKADFDAAKTDFDKIKQMGDQLAAIEPRRLLWPELIKVVSDALPRDAAPMPAFGPATRDQMQAALVESHRVEIDQLDCEHYADLGIWFAEVRGNYEGPLAVPSAASSAGGQAASAAAPAVGTTPAPGTTGAPDATQSAALPGGGPTGEGWVIQIRGHTYHSKDANDANINAEYVRRTFVRALNSKPILLPDQSGKVVQYAPRDLGIGYAVMVDHQPPRDMVIPIPGTAPGNGATDVNFDNHSVKAQETDFVVQFAWQETPINKRSPGGGSTPPAVPAATKPLASTGQ